MTYHQIIQLKNGASCCLRSGTAADGQAALDNFILTHAETDNLLTYPEENTLTATQEGEYLQTKTESPNEVEILAIVDGKVAGTAGINAVGGCYKLQHRAEFGISIAKEFWGLGIGQALTAACIDCARKAGYAQLELDVVADNASALALYKKFGFVEYGRNPKGFRSRNTGYQELVLMRLALAQTAQGRGVLLFLWIMLLAYQILWLSPPAACGWADAVGRSSRTCRISGSPRRGGRGRCGLPRSSSPRSNRGAAA